MLRTSIGKIIDVHQDGHQIAWRSEPNKYRWEMGGREMLEHTPQIYNPILKWIAIVSPLAVGHFSSQSDTAKWEANAGIDIANVRRGGAIVFDQVWRRGDNAAVTLVTPCRPRT